MKDMPGFLYVLAACVSCVSCVSAGEGRDEGALDALIAEAYEQNHLLSKSKYTSLDEATKILFQRKNETLAAGSIDKLILLLDHEDGWVVAKSADILQLVGCAGVPALPAVRAAQQRFPRPEARESPALVRIGELKSVPSIIENAANKLGRMKSCHN